MNRPRRSTAYVSTPSNVPKELECIECGLCKEDKNCARCTFCEQEFIARGVDPDYTQSSSSESSDSEEEEDDAEDSDASDSSSDQTPPAPLRRASIRK